MKMLSIDKYHMKKQLLRISSILSSIICLICITNISIAQNKDNNEVITTQIYNYVSKNIICSRILSNYSSLGYDQLLNLFHDENSCKLLPDSGYYLDMKISKLNWEFPNQSYSLYSISKPGWNFLQTTIWKTFNSSSKIRIDSTFLPKDDALRISFEGIERKPFSKDYLVAYNQKEDKILFVSGNFFTSQISNFYSLRLEKPSSFESYLKLKLYSIELKDLKFYKRNRNKIFFKITYGWNNEIGYAELRKSNFEKIIIHTKPPRVIVPIKTKE